MAVLQPNWDIAKADFQLAFNYADFSQLYHWSVSQKCRSLQTVEIKTEKDSLEQKHEELEY